MLVSKQFMINLFKFNQKVFMYYSKVVNPSANLVVTPDEHPTLASHTIVLCICSKLLEKPDCP